jgi:hypothetical protein
MDFAETLIFEQWFFLAVWDTTEEIFLPCGIHRKRFFSDVDIVTLRNILKFCDSLNSDENLDKAAI